jgi:hypothetical protein
VALHSARLNSAAATASAACEAYLSTSSSFGRPAPTSPPASAPSLSHLGTESIGDLDAEGIAAPEGPEAWRASGARTSL